MGIKTARMAEKSEKSSTYYNRKPLPSKPAALPPSPRGRQPSQALPRQLSQRESQAVNLDAEVLGTKRKLPAALLPLPLGEVDANAVSRRRGRTLLRSLLKFQEQ